MTLFPAVYQTNTYGLIPSITVTGTVPAFITITGTQITVNTSDTTMDGTYTITVNLNSNYDIVNCGSYVLVL